MNERTATRLHDALMACQQIESFTSGLDLSAYLQNDVVRLAIERLLEIIGEALNVASRDEPALIQGLSRISR